MTLTCQRPDGSLGNPVWTKGNNREPVDQSSKYELSGNKLIVKSVSSDDVGRYECKYGRNGVPYVLWSNVRIEPDPNIVANFQDKTVKCNDEVEFRCCVNKAYEVQLKNGDTVLEYVCEHAEYGVGKKNQTSVVGCEDNEIGNKTIQCVESNGKGQWRVTEDNCVLREIIELQTESANLVGDTLPEFVEKLNNVTANNEEEIVESTATISSIVTILNSIASVSEGITVNKPVMQNFLQTMDVVVSAQSIGSWNVLNNENEADDAPARNTSSSLLGSVETIVRSLADDPIEITTRFIHLKKIHLTESKNTVTVNSSEVTVPATEVTTENTSITTVAFSTLNSILPSRSKTNVTNSSIEAIVLLVNVSNSINNISINFELRNDTLEEPMCVFWNFSLFNNSGGWDSTGCNLTSGANGTVTCECNHTTSFSVLMAPYAPFRNKILDFITYIGVGISMGSLVLCLIIEIVVWKSVTKNVTSYVRHVSIVNIAVSLLIADIWFIIGASISEQRAQQNGRGQTLINACVTATFFIHFFYLALFFWMLVSALLLLYRTVMVLSQMSRSTMTAISFTVGYGVPLIIVVITVAVTQPNGGYISENHVCWLAFGEQKTLLAFVVPALIVVAVNLVIVIVVIAKLLRRGVGESTQPEEKNTLLVIVKCVAFLTPIFGLTWGFGIGTMVDYRNFGLHVVFALLNSLQGFFILVFGTLLDSKILTSLTGKLTSVSSISSRTKTTSAGTSSSSLNIFRRKRKNVYNYSRRPSSSNSSSSGASNS
ncbi:adhesion G-protein coupled receptor F1-like [Chanos chanos]|uniref:Adhesion G-protein coupled receptor F1-like n=1 Tax=Chanos chanos TaxID=29144 RepID=A0A6J2V8B2_CHACN|nr:adhesion G-protein coupled receptor F1-like [Chanos chanos]